MPLAPSDRRCRVADVLPVVSLRSGSRAAGVALPALPPLWQHAVELQTSAGTRRMVQGSHPTEIFVKSGSRLMLPEAGMGEYFVAAPLEAHLRHGTLQWAACCCLAAA